MNGLPLYVHNQHPLTELFVWTRAYLPCTWRQPACRGDPTPFDTALEAQWSQTRRNAELIFVASSLPSVRSRRGRQPPSPIPPVVEVERPFSAGNRRTAARPCVQM